MRTVDAVISVLEKSVRYLLLLRPGDLLDIALMAGLIYLGLGLVKSTRSEAILKGVGVLLLMLVLSGIFKLQSINYLLTHMMEWGVLALVVLFQPESFVLTRRLLMEPTDLSVY